MERSNDFTPPPDPVTSHQTRQNEYPSAVEDTIGTEDYQPSSCLQAEKKRFPKRKIVALGGILLALLIIIIALVCHFVANKKNQDTNSRQDKNVNSHGPNDGNGSETTATNDTILGPNGELFPNPNYELKRVFYGMAYVPMNAQLPNCGATAESVAEELRLLARTTRRVRLYGTDCNVLEYTLQAIKSYNLDLKVNVGIWIDSKHETFVRQEASMLVSLEKHGWDNIIGISVGNEVLYDNYQPLSVLIECVKQVKDKVMALGHSDVPVFTSELLEGIKPSLVDKEDIAAVNLHPFFSGINIEGAAEWFWKYFNNHVKIAVRNSTKPIWITEVGWPSFPASGAIKGSVPSVQNLQVFIDTWLCKANEKKLPYYFFEFFDAPWKIFPGTPVEGFWGIMTIDKKLKVKLPDCLAD